MVEMPAIDDLLSSLELEVSKQAISSNNWWKTHTSRGLQPTGPRTKVAAEASLRLEACNESSS